MAAPGEVAAMRRAVAPVLFGARSNAVADLGVSTITGTARLELTDVARFGADFQQAVRLVRGECPPTRENPVRAERPATPGKDENMFTGIVEELGEVVALESGAESARITVRGPVVTGDATHGASIAVNGVCLTVVEQDGDTFTADVMLETLRRTSLAGLGPGTRVNLERSLAAAGRLGGHIVQGHVDGTGTVLDRVPGDRWEVVRIALPSELARYVVEKGSIAVDGVSLTVATIEEGAAAGPAFTVSLIPETLTRTTLGLRAPGETVNLEVDVLAKYVERLVGASDGTPR